MRKADPARREARRRKILRAATRCFERHGIRGASISQICGKAQISPGHLYHYFESKEAIIRAMADEALAAATSHFSKQLKTSDALRIVEEIINYVGTHGSPGRILLFDMLAEAARDRGMAALLHEHSARVRELIRHLLSKGQARGEIDRGLDPQLAAAAVMSLMDGAQTLSIRNPDLDTQQAVDVFKSAATRLLKPQPAEASP